MGLSLFKVVVYSCIGGALSGRPTPPESTLRVFPGVMGWYWNCFMLTKYPFYHEMARFNLPKSPEIWLKSPFLRSWEVVEDGQRSHIVRCEFIYTKCSSLTYIQHPDFPKTDDLTARGRQCSVFLIFHRLAQKVVFSVQFGQQLFRSDQFF